MSVSIVEERSRYVTAAKQALREGDYHTAFVQIAKAAKCARTLADKTDGEIAQAHLADAQGLFERAKLIQQKSDEKKRTRPVTKGASSKQASVGTQNTTVPVSEQDKEAAAMAAQWIISKPDVSLKDVAGMDDVKNVISDVVFAMEHADWCRRVKIPPGDAALMHGPPGTGKTHVAKAIAGELDATFIAPNIADIKGKYQGDTEKAMQALFNEAEKYDQAVIFLDEIDLILGKQNKRAAGVFLTRTQGIEDRKSNLLILGATNFPENLHPAAYRRLKNMIHVTMPDQKARERIFEIQFDVPDEHLSYDKSDFPFDEFATRSDGYSGSDIRDLCIKAKTAAKQRDPVASPTQITKEDVFFAIAAWKPTTTQEQIEHHYTWRGSSLQSNDQSDDREE